MIVRVSRPRPRPQGRHASTSRPTRTTCTSSTPTPASASPTDRPSRRLADPSLESARVSVLKLRCADSALELRSAARRLARSAVRRMASTKVSKRAGGRSWPMPSMSSSSARGWRRRWRGRRRGAPSGRPCRARPAPGSRSARSRGLRFSWVNHGHHLAQHAAGGPAAVEGLLGPGQHLVVVVGERRRADQRPDRDAGPRVRRRGRGRGGRQRRQQARVLPAHGALARGRHDAGQREHPVGCSMAMVCAIMPPIDTPTTWAASRPRWSSRPKRVGGQVAQRVRRAHTPAGEGAHQHGPADTAGHLGGPAGVAVVVADDEEATLGEQPAERRVPPGHRPAQAHHQQQRLAVGVAEGLVAELDTVAAGANSSSETGDRGCRCEVVRQASGH